MTLRLRRFQGKWIAEDREAGYYREMDDCDGYTLMADMFAAEHIRLRVAAAKSEHPSTREAQGRIASTEAA
jgi:hypothetical protein